MDVTVERSVAPLSLSARTFFLLRPECFMAVIDSVCRPRNTEACVGKI